MELFGQTPWQIQQGMNQQMNDAADKYASQDPFQRAAAGMHRAGGMLAGPVAGALGMENPAIAQAKRTEQVMGSPGTDLNSSAGLLAKAEQFRQAGDLRTATALAMKGQELRKQEQAAILAARKQDFQEQQMYDLKLQELSQRGEIAKQRSEDSRLAAGDRAAAMRESNQIRLQIAQLAAAANQSGGMSAAEVRQMKYEDAKAEKLVEKQKAAQSTLDQFDSLERNIEQLYDPKSGALTPAAQSLFGQMNQFRPDLALSQKSVDAETALTGLKDQITMSNLAAAKTAVGQSFGSMQVQEWDKFVRLLSSLDRKMSPDQAAKNIKYVTKFINDKRDVLKTALSAGEKSPPQGGLPQGATVVGKTPDGKPVYQTPDGKKWVQ